MKKVFICRNKFGTVINRKTYEIKKLRSYWKVYGFSETTGFGAYLGKSFKTKKEALEFFNKFVPEPYTSLFGTYEYSLVQRS
jgi:hypothetical protein